jgi:D-citramalate synthase
LDLPSTVSIRVEVKGEKHLATGAGSGGFDAFIDAISKVLKNYDYCLPGLADYEIRIPKGGHASALTECVITWDCGNELRKTRGVHVNQVYAAVLATTKLINIQLHEMTNNINP